jgi:D-tyrosyl-tRNA(Tyr) deacylase
MRLVIQRVSEASVTIDGQVKDQIGAGLLLLLGIEGSDSEEDIDYLCNKLILLRIFGDEQGRMNLSVQDTKGEIMVISQFTLFAQTQKGNRPSFIRAARPEQAIPLYERFIEQLQLLSARRVACGTFGADMKVALINDGPVTILLDSRQRDL